MASVQIDGQQTVINKKGRNPVIEFDKLQMYFAEPYVIDLEGMRGKITVYQPTIGDIVKFGENRFKSTLNIFTTNTTAYRAMLWDAGLDWNDVSDFQLFIMLRSHIDSEACKLIFHDFDFSLFEPLIIEGEPVLYNVESDILINENVYFYISQYLRNVFQIFPEEKLTKDNTLKQWYIESDKRKIHNAEVTGKKDTYSMLPVISACINHPGFKYNLQQLKEVGVCQFYDSVKRLQVYENTTAVLKGMYGGMMDSSKLKPEDYNFMKEL